MIYTYYKNIGKNIYLRYKDGDNTVSKRIDFYEPKLYTESNDESTLKSFFGHNLSEIQFQNIYEAREFAKRYGDVNGMTIHGNSNYANQFIIEMLQGTPPDYDTQAMRGGLLDIEVVSDNMPQPEDPKWPITAICTYDTITKLFTVYCLKPTPDAVWDQSKSDKDVANLNVKVVMFDEERSLLRAFLEYFKQSAFDYTSGWNSEQFDMPYIVERMKLLLGEKITSSLSPFNRVDSRVITGTFGQEQLKVDILGVPHLDYIALYKKHRFVPRSSYKLGNIAEVELGTTKLTYEEEGNLRNLYYENFQKYIDYNIIDVSLIKQLEHKLGFFDVTFALSYFTLSNYEDTLGTVKIWEQLIAKSLYNIGKVPLFKGEGGSGERFDGAFVKDVEVGKHKNIVSYDLKSLYPHIEQQCNIGLETHVSPEDLPDEVLNLRKYTYDDILHRRVDLSVLKKYNLSMSPSFEFYRRDISSVVADIKRDLYAMRSTFKQEMLDAEQLKNIARTEMIKRGLEV